MDTTTDHLQLTEGRWWRFSAYEVRDGWVRPAEGARLEEYEPWLDYELSWDDRQAADPKISRVVVPPYQKLMDLASLRRMDTPEACDRVTDWCGEFGLLGLMSHSVLSVTFPPRWVHNRMDNTIVPGVTEWTRRANGWHGRSGVFYLRNPDGTRVSGRPADIGSPVSDCGEFELLPREAANRRKISSFYSIETTSVATALGDYFPDLACLDGEGSSQLIPLGERFWRESAEKATDIYGAAFAFRKAMGRLAEKRFGANSNSWDIENALETLAVYASGVSQQLVVSSEDYLSLRWTSTSLLASLATMAMQDLAEGRVRRCGARRCERVFVSASDRAVYCSSRCRERETKARYRARNKSDARKNGGKRNGKKTRK